MPIPSQFNTGNPRQDLMTWFNEVVSKLSEKNSEIFYVNLYWANLTTAQKNGVKAALTNLVGEQKTQLDAIVSYVTNET